MTRRSSTRVDAKDAELSFMRRAGDVVIFIDDPHEIPAALRRVPKPDVVVLDLESTWRPNRPRELAAILASVERVHESVRGLGAGFARDAVSLDSLGALLPVVRRPLPGPALRSRLTMIAVLSTLGRRW